MSDYEARSAFNGLKSSNPCTPMRKPEFYTVTTLFTSDHHFGHANIIKYCSRPYNSVGHMNALMENTWNAVVNEGDTVYYVGDFAMQPSMVTEILPRLNGTKVLIAGNHDRCHGGAEKWVDHYLNAGFISIHKHLDLEIAGENVLVHHFPYRNEADPGQKFFGSRPVDKGGWLIHGHVHNRWKVARKQINVSVEIWDYAPVALETIAELIKQGPQTTAAKTGDDGSKTSYEERIEM
jgi:calcineurin-like phosphoesterase family protein